MVRGRAAPDPLLREACCCSPASRLSVEWSAVRRTLIAPFCCWSSPLAVSGSSRALGDGAAIASPTTPPLVSAC
eukprot:4116570-Prymnesium_polylepis.1